MLWKSFFIKGISTKERKMAKTCPTMLMKRFGRSYEIKYIDTNKNLSIWL